LNSVEFGVALVVDCANQFAYSTNVSLAVA